MNRELRVNVSWVTGRVDDPQTSWDDEAYPLYGKGEEMARQNQADTLLLFKRLLDSLDEDAPEFPELKAARAKLGVMYERLQALYTEQAALTAAKQTATREIRTLLEEGRSTANFLRLGLQTHYGKTSEQLVEFGIQPFRRRSRRKKQPAPGNGGEPSSPSSEAL